MDIFDRIERLEAMGWRELVHELNLNEHSDAQMKFNAVAMLVLLILSVARYSWYSCRKFTFYQIGHSIAMGMWVEYG